MNSVYKLIFFVPATHLDQVKKQLFKIGAGKSKNYSACCWETLGTFQFIPLEGSKPQTGKKNQLTASAEYKVEMLCKSDIIDKVIKTLLLAHPYDEPAYEIHKIYTLEDIKRKL